MERIVFNTYKVANKLPLSDISSFFDLKTETGWKQYIKLSPQEIERILKYQSNKKVFLYKYGCITFVGFNQDEIHVFLDFLRNSFVETDSRLFTHYNESHIMTVSDDGYVKLWNDTEHQFKYTDGIVEIVADVLSKSTELYKIESELTVVLDEAELFIGYLDKGRLRANTKKVVSIIEECIKFKFNTIESIKLLDRPLEFNKTIKTRKIFDVFSDYFELNDRYDDLKNRINVLDSITEEYFEFRSNQSERRLLLFEILLLSIFPLMRLFP